MKVQTGGETRSRAPALPTRRPSAAPSKKPSPDTTGGSTPPSRIERRRKIRKRQARVVMVTCLALCAVVLITSFPATGLMRQRNQISSDRSELSALNAQNKSLEQQATDLSEPSYVANLARRDYEMIRQGEEAFTILPSAKSSASEGAEDGRSSLGQGVITPGSSESEALVEGSASSPSKSVSDDRSAAKAHTTKQSTLWGRVLNSLEFWH